MMTARSHTIAAFLSLIVVVAFVGWLFLGEKPVKRGTTNLADPTADQVYGCTIKKQLPNGDCP